MVVINLETGIKLRRGVQLATEISVQDSDVDVGELTDIVADSQVLKDI